MDKALEISHVSKKIGKKQILQDINLSIEAGEIVGLIGPNGAGKTSLMKLIAGYNFPTEGRIAIAGYEVGGREHTSAMRNGAFLVEEPGFYPQLTGRYHLEMVCKSRGIPIASIEEQADFLNFESQLDSRVKTYSIGMKQRLGLAMCWVVQPRLLVLDEPLNGLDPDGIFLLRQKMAEAAAGGMAILISSHLLSELQKVAHRFVFLQHGNIIGEDSAKRQEELENRYRSLFGTEEERR